MLKLRLQNFGHLIRRDNSLEKILMLGKASLIAQLVKNPPAMQETPGLIPGLGRSAGEGIGYPLQYSWASLVAQLVRNLLTMRETWVLSLGWEDPLEKGKATHSSVLAWRIPWTVKSMGSQRVRHGWVTHFTSLHFTSKATQNLYLSQDCAFLLRDISSFGRYKRRAPHFLLSLLSQILLLFWSSVSCPVQFQRTNIVRLEFLANLDTGCGGYSRLKPSVLHARENEGLCCLAKSTSCFIIFLKKFSEINMRIIKTHDFGKKKKKKNKNTYIFNELTS